jgi:hypothetical protein
VDWNVFFSTISQTSGAIVGIFAAFLITKIVSNQTEFSKIKNIATQHLIDSETTESKVKARNFDWYNRKKIESAMEQIEYNVLSSRKVPYLDECMSKYEFSPFDDFDKVRSIIGNKLTSLSEKLDAEQKKQNFLKSSHGVGVAIAQSSIRPMPPIANIAIIHKSAEERELIDQLIINIERQAKKNEALNAEMQEGVDSVNLVTFSIIAVLILFFAGVIYPLSFLPWDQKKEVTLSLSAFWNVLFSLQGFMLTLISVIFSTLMFVFLYINNKLKHSNKVIERIAYYSDVSNYSSYLSNYIKNKKN